MNDKDQRFLEKRRKIGRMALALTVILFGITIFLALFLFWQQRGWIDPTWVANQISRGQMTRSQLETTATLLPVIVWMVLVLLFFISLMCLAIFGMERMYLAIVHRLQAEAEGSAEGQPDPRATDV